MNKEYEAIRKELSLSIVNRIKHSGMKGKLAERIARNMLAGASNLALIQGDKDLAREIHASFSDVVEYGLQKVFTWAGEPMPVEDGSSVITKEAA